MVIVHISVCLISYIGLVPIGGAGLSSMDGILIYEELAYGCTGIVSPIVANDLAVSLCVCVSG